MKKYKIGFVYQGDESVKKVALAGTFNRWCYEKDYFEDKGNGKFEIVVQLPMGRHFYKFVVNDQKWILDPGNPDHSEDGQNNSALTINESGEKVIRRINVNEQTPSELYLKYEALESPEWLKKGIIYQLHLKAFTEGGIKGAKGKLAYLKDLGISIIWIMPFFKTGIKNRISENGDPYAVMDFYQMDSAIGDEAALKDLVKAAHQIGIKVIFDIPINRVAIDHVWTKTHPEYFTYNDKGEAFYEVPGRTSFAGFDFKSKDLLEEIVKVIRYWTESCEFDGIRLDDTDITPLDFLTALRKKLNEMEREFVIISQAYDEYHHINFCNLTYDGFLREAAKDLSEERMTQEAFMTQRLAMQYSFPKAALRMNWLEEKEQVRIHKFLKPEALKPAIELLMTCQGVPTLVMGQEFNERTYQTYESLFNPYHLDWEHKNQGILNEYQKWIQLRSNHEALWKGEMIYVKNPYHQVISFIRRSEKESLLVVINFGEEAYQITFETLQIDTIRIEGYTAKYVRMVFEDK